MFSVGDLHHKLKDFKAIVGTIKEPLYFVKVDVKSAFDTIPQKAITDLMISLSSAKAYRIHKHAQIKAGEGVHGHFGPEMKSKPMKRWLTRARPVMHGDSDTKAAEFILPDAQRLKNTIVVENVATKTFDRDELLGLLLQHVQHNMVKIGKKFYRQAHGIPQGSVLSSLLCNYFYADLEATHLDFLQKGNGQSVLMRLIDDFMLVTTNKHHASKFLNIMHQGFPDYGVKINKDKTLVNFEIGVDGAKVNRVVGSNLFPYCGCLIDMKTLSIQRDRARSKNNCMLIMRISRGPLIALILGVADSMTVELARRPGLTFYRKILSATFLIIRLESADHMT